jgi:hypothetical protein
MFLGVAGGFHVVHGAHLFVLSNAMQAGLAVKAAEVRNGSKLSQCNMIGEAFPRLGVQGVEVLVLVGALFPLDGGRRREGEKREKKKIHHGEGGFPWGWTHLLGCAVGCSCYVQLKADLWVSL